MSSDTAPAPIGILCALPEELRLYREEVAHAVVRPHGGMEVVQGTLDGRRVVLVESGIGKVNAASAATILIEHYGCDRLLLSGVAGALDPALSIGDVVVGTHVVQHDYGRVTDEGPRAYQPGAMPVPGASDRVGWPLRADLLAHVRAALAGDPLRDPRTRGGAPHVPTVHFGGSRRATSSAPRNGSERTSDGASTRSPSTWRAARWPRSPSDTAPGG